MCKKILVVRYRFIGDTLLTVPFLRNLRMAYPDAQIDLLVGPVSGEIIEKCPYVDNFIYFDTTKKHRYENKNGVEKKDFWSYVNLLKQEKYDKAYVLKRSLSSAFLVFAAGIKERIGFDTEMRGFLLTKRVPYVENRHEIECFLDVLRADGIDVQNSYLENWTDENENEKVLSVMKSKGLNFDDDVLKVIVHATSGNRKKEWAKDKWADIIQWLSEEKNVQVLFNGTKNDSLTYEEILSYLPNNGNDLKYPPINFCGEFSLRETLAFTEKTDLIVGCDSGNLHIAASVGVPVIGIYGPMNTEKWKAWADNSVVISLGLPCQPCGLKKKCKNDYSCIKNISVERVRQEIEVMFKNLEQRVI
jgi:heptosyltransferase-2